MPQILESLAVPATRWGLLPELNRRAALRTLGVLIDRLVAGGPGVTADPPAGAGGEPGARAGT
ncbi:MAG TPA: hypothetical protein VE733_09450 [Streptosporangiaceae bacterium]|nr:hypothetical protein [Streptosporangiaceae bacterium]